MAGMLAVLAQDPDSGIIDYGSCDVQHRNQSGVVQELDERKKEFKTIRVQSGGPKKRTLRVLDERITLRGYHEKNTMVAKSIRQIAITGHGKIKPALIITNDFDLTTQEIVRK